MLEYVDFITVEVSALYPWVLLTAFLIALECLMLGFVAGGRRSKAFNQEFMTEHFEATHKEATGKTIEKGGYPDTGNGLFSDKLEYK